MNGNLIGAVNTPTLASATGVWDIEELKLAQQQGTWPLFKQPDPDFEYVSLLLSSETAVTNGAQNNTFQDSSTNNFTITRNGNTTQGSFSPYLPNWSNYFDGSGDSLTVAANAAFVMGLGDFTIEGWCYQTGKIQSYPRMVHFGPFALSNDAWGILPRDGDYPTKITVFSSKLGGRILISSSDFDLNKWNHVAVTRDAGVFRLFVNGKLEAVNSSLINSTTEASATNTVAIGSATTTSGGEDFLGHISNVRILKGSVVPEYQTSSTTVGSTIFNPASAPLTNISNTSLLTCQSNRFIDNSTNNFTITRNGGTRTTPFSPFSSFVATKRYVPATYGGSGYFDGSGDFLTYPANSAMNFGAGDFTVEGWIYPITTPGDGAGIFAGTSGSGNPLLLAYRSDLGYWAFGRSFIAWDHNFGTQPPILNAWQHLAVSRTGTTLRLFFNGSLVNTATSSQAYSMAGGGTQGFNGTSGYLNGYIAGARATSTALYTSSFVPPAAPLTAVASTQLLINFTNGGIIDSAALNVVETVGNAQVNIAVKKYGSGSYYFDGTGDYLVIPNNVLSQFGSGNLTWEMWINTTSSTQYATLYSRTPSSFSTGMWILMINMASSTAGDVGLYMADYSAAAPLLQTTAVNARDGNWHHVAVVRNGSSWVLYVDGISRATQTWSGTIATITAATYVGADQFYGRNYLGYISDLRLTGGLARYTANFTPPTASLPQF